VARPDKIARAHLALKTSGIHRGCQRAGRDWARKHSDGLCRTTPYRRPVFPPNRFDRFFCLVFRRGVITMEGV
jgi:hypothetical protein